MRHSLQLRTDSRTSSVQMHTFQRLNWSPEVGLAIQFLLPGVLLLNPHSLLTEPQREAAVALFEQGCGVGAVVTRLGLPRESVRALHRRWTLHSKESLVRKTSNTRYPFAIKLEVVGKFVNDQATALDLAREYRLSSERLVRTWAQAYREHGEDGLRPEKDRTGTTPPPPKPKASNTAELQQLQQENLRLRAENAYLKKLRALIEEEQQ